ncbi:carboxypeptidase regulatory-like domain-containing protein [Macrococcoides goetzii]|nr:carboxypeptidase-like regulatory domain-containing protein [Macrococcus goetzii]TDM39126.1 carboxypeptidase regulatory-like domain-containing protein [Macrococcus goetzii]
MKNNKNFKKISIAITSSILGTVGLLNQSVVTHAAELQNIEQQITRQHAFYLQQSSLRILEGYIYYDENNDGQWDSRLGNIKLELIGRDGITYRGSTNSEGYFYFTGMNPGSYELRMFVPVVDKSGIETIEAVSTAVKVDHATINRLKVTVTQLSDNPSTEIPTTETPTTETPTTETPTTEAPTTETPTTETPTTEPATTEAPTTEPPTTEPATIEIPTTEPATTEPPTTEASTTEIPTTEPATTEAPTTEPPTTEPATIEIPTTEPATTEPPTTEASTTEIRTTEPPTTEIPSTERPTTERPTTEIPSTERPTTERPTTERPTTETPTTEPPTTEAPTTEPPTTEPATIEIPTTEPPTTEAPTTEPATIEIPTTETPTTETPTPEHPVVIIPPTVELPPFTEPISNLPGEFPHVDNNEEETERPSPSNVDTEIPDADSLDIHISYLPTGTIVRDNENVVSDGDVVRSVVYMEQDEGLPEILYNPYQPLFEENTENNNRDDELAVLRGLKPLKLPESDTIVDKDNGVNPTADNNQKPKTEEKEDIEVAKTNVGKAKDKHHPELKKDNFQIVTIDEPLDGPSPALPTFISGLGGLSY